MALNNIRAFEVIWENGLQFIHHQMFQIKILIRKCDFLPQVQFGSKVWSGADQIFDPHGISKRIIHSSINILIQKHPHSGKKKRLRVGGFRKRRENCTKSSKTLKKSPTGPLGDSVMPLVFPFSSIPRNSLCERDVYEFITWKIASFPKEARPYKCNQWLNQIIWTGNEDQAC